MRKQGIERCIQYTSIFLLLLIFFLLIPYPYFRIGDVWNISVGIHKKMASGCLQKKELGGLRIVSEKNYLSHYVSFVSNLVLSANTVYSKKFLN